MYESRGYHLSKLDIGLHYATFTIMSIATVFSMTSIMLGLQCDYTISYKAEAHHIHKHHSDHTVNGMIFSLIAALAIGLVSCVPILASISYGLRDYSQSGFRRYMRNHNISLSLSVFACVTLSIISGLAIGTEI